MNIVNSGNKFVVYGDEVRTFQTLPAETFRVCLSQQEGFFLVKHNDLTVDEKIYGPYAKKVKKVMDTYDQSTRNLGIILSGPKGVGKSVFARLLSEEGKKRNLPTIIVNFAANGIDTFISSITQECIVLFDEFEKVFRNDEGDQDKLLSLFDGVDNGRKLFVITCNKTYELSEYLLNRPGRFHYHFMLGAPDYADAKEYLEDSLVESAKGNIENLLNYHTANAFTYDILRAIVQELNCGYSLKETLQDLNVQKKNRLTVNPVVTFNNGVVLTCPGNSATLNMDEDRLNLIWMELKRSSIPEELRSYVLRLVANLRLEIPTMAVKCDTTGYHIDPEDVILHMSDWMDSLRDMDGMTEDEKQRIIDFMSGFDSDNIKSVQLKSSINGENYDARKFDC